MRRSFGIVQKDLEMFYNAMEPLKNKLLTLLIQFPPYFKIKEGLEALRQYDFFFDETYRYAIEVRHPSWFSDLAYNFFKNNNISLVWNQARYHPGTSSSNERFCIYQAYRRS